MSGFHCLLFNVLKVICIALTLCQIACGRNDSGKPLGNMSDQELRDSMVSALGGDADSALKLAEFYLHVKRDVRLGYSWIERSAILGNPKAKAMLNSFLSSSGLEAYREVLGRTNLTQERLLFDAIGYKEQEPSATKRNGGE